MADAEDCLLPGRADPEMPAVEEVIDPVLLGRDRVVGRRSMHLDAGDVDLEATRRARIGADGSAHAQRRFLGEVVRTLEDLVADSGLGTDGPGEPACLTNLSGSGPLSA